MKSLRNSILSMPIDLLWPRKLGSEASPALLRAAFQGSKVFPDLLELFKAVLGGLRPRRLFINAAFIAAIPFLVILNDAIDQGIATMVRGDRL